ncbi:ejaculatory bulb-specific protein 3-like [Uranotaenia lowii]|uniref:ejaculatory bulb-specific protein 3-like n=1 Tax=Uranotaenia lowii TaxID=190385 RepID=UPI002478A6C3|nr:ejaculatory bulb-specific protein 3-like [Uranotaenia lowii]
MKILVLLLTMAAAAVVAGQNAIDIISTINVDEVLASDRLTKNYFDCFMDKKPCTREGTEIKVRIGPYVEKLCSENCSGANAKFVKVYRYLQKNKEAILKELIEKYDPNNEFFNKCGEQLMKE